MKSRLTGTLRLCMQKSRVEKINVYGMQPLNIHSSDLSIFPSPFKSKLRKTFLIVADLLLGGRVIIIELKIHKKC